MSNRLLTHSGVAVTICPEWNNVTFMYNKYKYNIKRTQTNI